MMQEPIERGGSHGIVSHKLAPLREVLVAVWGWARKEPRTRDEDEDEDESGGK